VSEALEPYWTRTLRQFKGCTVDITVDDGRVRRGVLTETPDGPRLFTEHGVARLPLGQLVQVAEA
jgi:hypothetical protein